MQYLVEIKRYRDAWRLQSDDSWRSIDGAQSIIETDRRFGGPVELHPFQRRFEVVLGEECMMANPKSFSLRAMCYTRFRVIRDQAPRTPTKDELRRVIAAGDDDVANTPIVDLGGTIRLKPWTDGRSPIHDLDIAVRMSTFDRRKGYIGREPAADGEFVNRVYNDLRRMWDKHVETGIMNIFDS